MATQTKRQQLEREITKQRAWIATHGSTRSGYVERALARLHSASDPDGELALSVEHDAERIYEADVTQLNRLLAELEGGCPGTISLNPHTAFACQLELSHRGKHRNGPSDDDLDRVEVRWN